MRYFVFLLLISINTITLSAKSKTPSGVDLRDSLVRYAKTLINTPYRSGSKNGNGFDCSGYTSYVYRKFGMNLNGSSGSQVANGKEVDIDNLKKGDLVFFKGHNSKNSRIGHVGIFLSHNQDGSFNFIHSANGGGVRIDNSNAGYYAKRYVTGCTVIPEKKKLYKFDPVQVKSFYESDNEVLYASTGKVHKVKKGESLYTIAKEYNVSEDQLKEWNKLSDTKLKPGQKLSIQSGKNSDKSKNNDSKATPSNRTGETHVVKKGESFYSIAHKYHISEEELIKANPAIDGKLKAGDKIQLTTGNATLSKKGKAELADEGTAKTVTSKKSHKVRKGETLSAIADKYGVSVDQLKRWNGISGKKLKPGSYLTVQMTEKEVPMKESRGESVAKSTKKENISNEEPTTKTVTSKKSHKVRKGETLSSVADKYGVSVEQLKRWNGISGKKLKPGSYLTVQMTEKEVPVKENRNESVAKSTKKENISNEEPATKTVTSKKSHKVRKGETLSSVADKYGVSVQQLKRWNGISGKKLKPGSYITVQMTEKEVPVKRNIKPEEEVQPEVKINPSEKKHIVAKGETLYSIAKSHHISALKIKEWNNLTGNQVHVGDTLMFAPKTSLVTAQENKPVNDTLHVQQTTAQPQVKEQVKEQGQEPNVKPVISTTPVADKIDTLFTSYKVNKTHLVQDGETLESIAELYQVTPAQIKAWNGLSKRRSNVTAGQKLTIETVQKEYVLVAAKKKRPAAKGKITQEPVKADEPESEPSVPAKPVETKYVVKKGETLFSIAKTTNLTVDQLKEYNHLSTTDVKEGTTLNLVPDSTTAASKKSETNKAQTTEISYTVKPGDTLTSIAKAHSISVDELKAANEMESGEVNIGQQLQIPVH